MTAEPGIGIRAAGRWSVATTASGIPEALVEGWRRQPTTQGQRQRPPLTLTIVNMACPVFAHLFVGHTAQKGPQALVAASRERE
jgi:hypothetical protein